MGRRLTGWLALGPAAMLLGACAHGGGGGSLTPSSRAGSPSQDPIGAIIATAEAHVAAGLTRASEGHLNQARVEFDRAVEVFLSAPGGARSEPRLADAYRRTLERVHVLELELLAAGDGFTEGPSEPAAIDEMAELNVEAQSPSEETRARARQALEVEDNDLPVALNDAVLGCIDLYLGPLREWFVGALQRGDRYLPYMRQVFAAEGLPRDLAYVALVESAFRPTALSRAKARGVWQFMPATGRRFGLRQDWWVDERSDPYKATRAAARYLKQLYGMFGDWNLALAGYNAGEQKVVRAIGRQGTRDFWELRRTPALRRETRNYVPMIHAAILVAKAPEKYGLVVVPEPVPEFDFVPLESALDLRVVAECADSTLDEVRGLNPELRRLVTPATRGFDVRVPRGRGLAVIACLANLPPEKRTTFRTHVVARGQSLSAIARRHGSRVGDIAEANGISPRARLSVGTTLIIPTAAHQSAARSRRADAVSPAGGAGATGGAEVVRHTIQPGDTLLAIAARYGTTVRLLRQWNGLRDSRIAAGGELIVRLSSEF